MCSRAGAKARPAGQFPAGCTKRGRLARRRAACHFLSPHLQLPRPACLTLKSPLACHEEHVARASNLVIFGNTRLSGACPGASGTVSGFTEFSFYLSPRLLEQRSSHSNGMRCLMQGQLFSAQSAPQSTELSQRRLFSEDRGFSLCTRSSQGFRVVPFRGLCLPAVRPPIPRWQCIQKLLSQVRR